MAELTPMKRQYYEIKQRNPDCLLFFRLGDFYEMFDDDARLAARELDLTLTTRDRNVEDPAERTPMCGVPYHSAEAYIGRLIAKGYKVAICEPLRGVSQRAVRRHGVLRPLDGGILRCELPGRRREPHPQRARPLCPARGRVRRRGGGT